MAKKEIVVLGAGYAGIRATQDLAKLFRREPDYQVTLINKHNYHQFITEIHKPAAGTASVEHARIPIFDLIDESRVNFIKATVTKIVPEENRLIFEDGQEKTYDYLLIGLGADPEFFNIPGLADHKLTLRSVNAARLIRTHIEKMMAEGKEQPADKRKAYWTFVIVGGGMTGIEFAGELAEIMPKLCREYDVPLEETKIYIIEALPNILCDVDDDLCKHAQSVLEAKGVEFIIGRPVAKIEEDAVYLKDGEVIRSKTVVWSAGVRGNRILDESNLPTAGRGRVVVDQYLRVKDHLNIFAAGDCAYAVNPKTGKPAAPNAHNAIDMGAVAARNIYNLEKGKDLEPFEEKYLGSATSLGGRSGIADVGKLKFKGLPATIFKEMINVKYVHSIGGVPLVIRRLLGHLRK
ncbi:MAG: NAD(P)/FAD-dependent oxidoreductase [Firmicutes bacterium]|nr:NAD(P)/FAD-dependent oxidoreductase [Bacillota bacterium]